MRATAMLFRPRAAAEAIRPAEASSAPTPKSRAGALGTGPGGSATVTESAGSARAWFGSTVRGLSPPPRGAPHPPAAQRSPARDRRHRRTTLSSGLEISLAPRGPRELHFNATREDRWASMLSG